MQTAVEKDTMFFASYTTNGTAQNNALVITDMHNEGISHDVVDELVKFLPESPRAIDVDRFRLLIDNPGEDFTADEIRALRAVADVARERVCFYRRMNGRLAVSVDHDRYYTINDAGEAVELI